MSQTSFVCTQLNGFNLISWVFYSISTLVGYLMPDPVYTYISNIYDLKTSDLDVIIFK